MTPAIIMPDLYIDVAVLTYRPDKKFIKLLNALEKQTVQPSKIIVVNTDETLMDESCREAVSTLSCELHHIDKNMFDHAGTRNLAASFSKSDYIIFMTQDAVPVDRHLLEELLRPMEDPDVAVSYARQLPGNAGIIEKYNRSFNYPDRDMLKKREDIPSLGIKTIFCSDVCACYRRSALDSLGGFEEPAVFNEDMVFADRAVEKGMGIYYASKARVLHSHKYTALQQFRRNFDLGASQAAHPEVFKKYRSEGEGKKLFFGCIRYLGERGKGYLIPTFLFHCAARYTGYLLGKNNKILSRKLILKITNDRTYWERYFERGLN